MKEIYDIGLTSGLKHIRGPHNTYLYKIQWVEEYLENQANLNEVKEKQFKIENINKVKKRINKCDVVNCQIV